MYFESAKIILLLNADNRAKVMAYAITPIAIVVAAILLQFHELTLDPDKGIVISELRTELSNGTNVRTKPGVAVIIEPANSDYHIQLKNSSSTLWSSLSEEDLHANKDHLWLNEDGLSGRGPFVGVADPVTVVVQGQLGEKIGLAARKEPINDWRLLPSRSTSILPSVLVICIFCFGISVATAWPSMHSDENTTTELSG